MQRTCSGMIQLSTRSPPSVGLSGTCIRCACERDVIGTVIASWEGPVPS